MDTRQSNRESNRSKSLFRMLNLNSLARMIFLLVGIFIPVSSSASTWSDINDFAELIQSSGTRTLVRKDCPIGLLGAFHSHQNALLICANNIENSPSEVWKVLAHESTHLMQTCNKGLLIKENLPEIYLAKLQKTPDYFITRLNSYKKHYHREEIEAQIIQNLSPNKVRQLFLHFCSHRITNKGSTRKTYSFTNKPNKQKVSPFTYKKTKKLPTKTNLQDMINL